MIYQNKSGVSTYFKYTDFCSSKVIQVLAKQFMSSHFVTVSVESTMEKGVCRFLDENAELLLVVDSNQDIVGIISEADLLAVTADYQRRNDPISLYIKRQYVSIHESAPLETVIDQFILHRVRCLPVVSQNRIVGVIHRRDIVRHLQHQSSSAYSAG